LALSFGAHLSAVIFPSLILLSREKLAGLNFSSKTLLLARPVPATASAT
jgi:hypothetical protein